MVSVFSCLERNLGQTRAGTEIDKFAVVLNCWKSFIILLYVIVVIRYNFLFIESDDMETYAIDYLDLFSQPVPTLQTVDIWYFLVIKILIFLFYVRKKNIFTRYFAVHFAKEFGWNPKPETFLCGTFPSEFSIYLSLLGFCILIYG
jgi:hypothetical protein